jgi:peptidoglycan/LPS O-acetylase OafA/YrhL
MNLKSNPQYRSDIDGLRGMAVLLVVAFHAGVRSMAGGFIGVDIFFVISGFLISGIIFKSLDEGHFSFANFYARRVRRIFPALITVLLFVWVVGWFTLTPDDYKQLGLHAAGAGFISNILLWKEAGYFATGAQFKPLLHLWSLGIEEQYYFVWPLALFFLWKTRFRILILILLFGGSFGLNMWQTAVSPAAAFYLPQTRFWELLVGGFAAYLNAYRSDSIDNILRRLLMWDCSPQSLASLQNVKASLGFLLIALALLKLDENRAFPGAWALLPTLGSLLLISAGPEARINQKILSNPLLVFVGLISYPLYLWHWPLLSFLRIVSPGQPSPIARGVAVASAFVVAWLTYRFVEKPVRRTKAQYRGVSSVQILVPAMLVACGLGVLTVVTKGFPVRLPADIRDLAAYDAGDHVSGWRQDHCFLNLEQDVHSFETSCTDVTPQDGPLLLLWGDSHAADLYPGIRALQDSHSFRVAQYTASLCAPLLNVDVPDRLHCREINDWIFIRVKELRPDTVILAAQNWFLHPTDSDASLSRTVAAIEQTGVRRIIIVGPNPQWKDSLPRLLLHSSITALDRIPERMTDEVNQEFIREDRVLRSQAGASGAIYLSPISVLCNESGCLTRITDSGQTDLISFDQHHLTLIASCYLAKMFFPSYFGGRVAQPLRRF